MIAHLTAGYSGGGPRTYDLIADLPVRSDEYALEGLEGRVSSVFTPRVLQRERSR